MCGFAKTMADRRLIRVVFITEGVAPKQLYQRNTWGMQDIEMGDIPLEQARSMLRDSVKRSEEHTSEIQSLMRISYAVFCLKNKNEQAHVPHTLTQSNYRYSHTYQ